MQDTKKIVEELKKILTETLAKVKDATNQEQTEKQALLRKKKDTPI